MRSPAIRRPGLGAFAGAELVWAIVCLVVLVSIVLHGVTATPVVSYVDPRE